MAAAGKPKSNGRDTLISVENLKMYFPVTQGIVFHRVVGLVKAVDDISFDIKKGETLGLVGESGCGKTTTGRCILRLNRATAGNSLLGKAQMVLGPLLTRRKETPLSRLVPSA